MIDNLFKTATGRILDLASVIYINLAHLLGYITAAIFLMIICLVIFSLMIVISNNFLISMILGLPFCIMFVFTARGIEDRLP
jgi:hypothetical protein